LAALALPVALPAAAQGNLNDLAKATSIDANGEKAIKDYADRFLPGLKSSNPRDVKASRQELLSPLGAQEISVAFRNAYAGAIINDLRALVSGTNEAQAVSALTIAGELSTTASVSLLRSALADPRAGVQYAAARSLGRVFQIVGKQKSPSVLQADIERAIKDLGTFTVKQTDTRMLTGCVNALRAAPVMIQPELAAVGVVVLADTLSALSKGELSPEYVAVLLPAASSLRDAATQQAAGGLPESAYTAIGGAAGDLLAAAARQLKAGKGDAASLQPLVAAAESMLIYSADGLKVQADRLNVGKLMTEGKTDQFLRDVPKWIGPSGTLTKPPFNFKAERFAF
jgi:hypothetical protein